MQEQEYIKGFNHGYLLAKYLPDLLNKLISGLTQTSDYLSGFFAGKMEYELEYTQKQLEGLKNLRESTKSQERDFGNK